MKSHPDHWHEFNKARQNALVETVEREFLRHLREVAEESKQQPTDWIKCTDRLPMEKDGDINGYVWAYWTGDKRSHYTHWQHIPNATHWKPTGLVRPMPPTMKE